MNRHSLRRAAVLAAPYAEWLVLLILVALAIPPVLIHHDSLTVVSHLDLLDGSWLLDTTYKAAGGIWFGRDVAFTYGPLYQWLASAPARWIGISTGTIYATSYTLPLIVIILSTFLCARLLFPETSAWKRTLFVLLAVVFWSPPDVRMSVCLLAFLIFVRMVETVAKGPSARVLLAIAAAFLCLAAFLLSVDTGLYSVAGLLLCVMAAAAAHAMAPGSLGRLAKFLAAAVVAFVVVMVVTNAVLFSPLQFQFWRASLVLATAYRWFEPISMFKAEKRLLLETLALGAVVFGAAWWWREPDGPRRTLRPAFLLSGFCLAFLMMQSALVRSDPGHVRCGIYPMVFLCSAILIGGLGSSRLLSAAALAIVVIVTLVRAHAFPTFLPSHAWVRVTQWNRPILACPEGYQEFDHACFLEGDAELLTNVALYVDLNTSPGDPILVFPYQTAFGATSRHQVAGGMLQSYLVNGDYLTSLELDGLSKASPPFGLYLPDGIMSEAIDGVPNFTRSPDLWFYLLRHYRSETSPVSGVVGLMRDDGRDQQVELQSETVAGPLPEKQVTKRSTSADMGPVQWPAAGADFLKLRLRVNYPLPWRLRKPSRLTLQMSFVDGSQKLIQFAVEPNRSSDIWVYPWDEKKMGSYFSNDESQWRSGSRPALTGLQLLITPFDWISVVPKSVSVANVEAVRVSLTR